MFTRNHLLHKLPTIATIRRNKNLLRWSIGIVVVIFITFFDENSILKRIQYHIQIIQLQKEINHYKQDIEQSKNRLNELNSNAENLEKFAREQFLMKKANEDIFLIDPDK